MKILAQPGPLMVFARVNEHAPSGSETIYLVHLSRGDQKSPEVIDWDLHRAIGRALHFYGPDLGVTFEFQCDMTFSERTNPFGPIIHYRQESGKPLVCINPDDAR